MKHEESLSIAVCKYIKLQYPNVLFTCESSGIRVPIGVAKRMKAQRSCNGLPDLLILKPNKQYHGLFLELKKEGTRIVKLNGELVADLHIREQQAVIIRLSLLNYYASFAIGFEEAKLIIDNYLKD